MPSVIRQILHNLGERVDMDLLPSLYQASTLSTAQIQREFMRTQTRWHDPSQGMNPDAVELQLAAHAVIGRCTRVAMIRGALGGSLGALAIPPEIAASLVQTLRMAQRLAVLYGFDPETARGQLLLSRALEVTYNLKLPTQRAMGVRMRDLRQVSTQQLPDVQRTTAWVARTVSWQMTRRIGGRIGRVLPGFGMGIGAWDARRLMKRHGQIMLQVYAHAWDGDLAVSPTNISEALEIREGS